MKNFAVVYFDLNDSSSYAFDPRDFWLVGDADKDKRALKSMESLAANSGRYTAFIEIPKNKDRHEAIRPSAGAVGGNA